MATPLLRLLLSSTLMLRAKNEWTLHYYLLFFLFVLISVLGTWIRYENGQGTKRSGHSICFSGLGACFALRLFGFKE